MYIKFIKNKIVRTNKPHLTSVYVLRWYIFSKYFLTAGCLHSVESPVASNSHAIASTVHENTLVGINYKLPLSSLQSQVNTMPMF